MQREAKRAPDGLYQSATRLLWLSWLEQEIVNTLKGKGWRVTARIAEDLHMEPTTTLRAIIANLAERGVVETSTQKGVRLLAPEPGQDRVI